MKIMNLPSNFVLVQKCTIVYTRVHKEPRLLKMYKLVIRIHESLSRELSFWS